MIIIIVVLLSMQSISEVKCALHPILEGCIYNQKKINETESSTATIKQNMLTDDTSRRQDCENGETGKAISQERIRSPQISKRKFDSMSPTTVTAVQVLESQTNTPSGTFMDQQHKSNANDIRCASRKRFKNVEDSLVPRQGRD